MDSASKVRAATTDKSRASPVLVLTWGHGGVLTWGPLSLYSLGEQGLLQGPYEPLIQCFLMHTGLGWQSRGSCTHARWVCMSEGGPPAGEGPPPHTSWRARLHCGPPSPQLLVLPEQRLKGRLLEAHGPQAARYPVDCQRLATHFTLKWPF